jgi:hypothetical protein
VKEGDLLGLLASLDGLMRFCTLILPGFIALTIFDMRVPGERRKFSEETVKLVAYSGFIDLIGAAVLLVHRVALGLPAALFVIVFGVIVPLFVGWIAVDVREWLSAKRGFLSPVPKAWDYFFSSVARGGVAVAIIVTLNNGKRVGGFWDTLAFSSSFPADEDLFIGTPCEIDQETGLITQRKPGSQGLLIKRDDILMIESFEAKSAIAEPTDEVTPQGAVERA